MATAGISLTTNEPPFSIDLLRGASSSPPPPLESLLPGVYRDESFRQLAVPSLKTSYLASELGLGRLDGYGRHWFWLLGAPALPRPLHDCVHRNRTICVTERMDRHLGLGLGASGAGGRHMLLYIKPLPRLLLDARFWRQTLACGCGAVAPSKPGGGGGGSLEGNHSAADEKQSADKAGLSSAQSPPVPFLDLSSASRRSANSHSTANSNTISSTTSTTSITNSNTTNSTTSAASMCTKRHLRECTLGFLYSYVALLPYESDFKLAQKHGLLPSEVDWTHWRVFCAQVATSADVRAGRFHARFRYGELRLNRLRELSQLRRGGLLPVLAGRLDRFARFFQNNVRWLASLVAYIAVVLSCLQTGLATHSLETSHAFQAFASGFTVFALAGPVAVLLAFALYFGVSLLYHVAVHVWTSHLALGWFDEGDDDHRTRETTTESIV